MATTIDVIFSKGVFHPLEPVTMPENHRLRLTVEPLIETEDSSAVAPGPVLTGEAWQMKFQNLLQSARDRADRYPENFVVDASREAMYPDDANENPS